MLISFLILNSMIFLIRSRVLLGSCRTCSTILTVHASGGHAVISAAVEQAPQVEITAVTILTSLSALDLQEIGFAQNPLDSAVKLALLSQGAGARAIVCSPHEIFAIRESVGPDLTIIAQGSPNWRRWPR